MNRRWLGILFGFNFATGVYGCLVMTFDAGVAPFPWNLPISWACGCAAGSALVALQRNKR